MPRLTPAERVTRHKATAIEYSKRVETVRRLLLSGMDTDTILQNVTAEYGVKPRMARHYLATAREKNQAWIDFHEADMFGEHIAIRRDIRRRAQAAGDRKMELAAARDEALMFGLYAAQKIEIHDWREAARTAGMTDAQIETAIAETATLFERIATGQAVAVKTETGGEKEGE